MELVIMYFISNRSQPLLDSTNSAYPTFQQQSSTFGKVKEYIQQNCPILIGSINENSYLVKLAEKKGFDAFVSYMEKPQFYQIVTRKIKIIGVANHVLIRLPGSRICDWSPKSGDVKFKEWTQLELRQTTGSKIEEMWQTHQFLKKEYYSFMGYLMYRPFLNDCFQYVNQILTANGQASTRLVRLPNCQL